VLFNQSSRKRGVSSGIAVLSKYVKCFASPNCFHPLLVRFQSPLFRINDLQTFPDIRIDIDIQAHAIGSSCLKSSNKFQKRKLVSLEQISSVQRACPTQPPSSPSNIQDVPSTECFKEEKI